MFNQTRFGTIDLPDTCRTMTWLRYMTIACREAYILLLNNTNGMDERNWNMLEIKGYWDHLVRVLIYLINVHNVLFPIKYINLLKN